MCSTPLQLKQRTMKKSRRQVVPWTRRSVGRPRCENNLKEDVFVCFILPIIESINRHTWNIEFYSSKDALITPRTRFDCVCHHNCVVCLHAVFFLSSKPKNKQRGRNKDVPNRNKAILYHICLTVGFSLSIHKYAIHSTIERRCCNINCS